MTIQLPRALIDEPDTTSPTSHRAPQQGAKTGGTVLVIDDSRALLALVTTLLKNNGYTSIAASSAEDALALITCSDPDVIITDVDMPGMDGISLCRELQAKLHAPAHIIILSKHSDQVVAGLDAGATDYVCKPFSTPELLARVSAGMRIVQRQKRMQSDNTHLRSSYDQLQAAKQHSDDDLSAAAELQFGLLPPSVSSCHGLTIACSIEPSSALSGDMIGVLPQPYGQLGLYSMDVSGKGTAAALLATALAQELRSSCPMSHQGDRRAALDGGRCVSEIVADLNARFQNYANSDRYSTMAFALLNSRNQSAEICVAGHPRPALLSAAGEVSFIGSGGFPVGLLETATYRAVNCAFRPGDRLVLYTDGFLEARLPGGAEVGYQGFAEMLRAVADRRIEDLAPELVRRLRDACRSAVHDDVSVIAASYAGI